MSIELKLENLPHNAKEAKVIKIYKNQGDLIKPGDILFDVEAGKGSTPIKTDVEGIVEGIKVKAGDMVKVNSVIAILKGERPAKEGSSNNTFNYFGNLIKPQKQEFEGDITIIGGGPGGYVAAIHAAKLGAKVVLVEKEALGGTCLNFGCIPTKAIVRSAQVLNTLKEAEEFGCYAENISLNMKKVIERKNKVVNQLVTGIKYLMDKHGIKVVNGPAKIVDKETVFVKTNMQETTIKTKNIIIATGSKTAKLPIPGLDNKNVITSNEALELTDLPRKMVVVGGGVIGMEFAYIFANFGVEVSVVEFFDNCLASCDDDIISENNKNAEKRGIKLYTGSKVEEIVETEDGELIVRFGKENQKKHLIADKVLVAVGRTPYFEGLGIEELGIEFNENKRGIKVNSRMQTNIDNIYAIGDVTNKILLAHVASHQGVVAVNNIMGKECEMDYRVVPGAIFTDPEIATVGITEREAKKQGIEIEVGKFPFAANGKALTYGETSGFVKVIKDKSTKKLIGAAIIGLHGTDLIAELTLAIKNNLSPEEIIETIHAHPTTAEVIHEGALSVEGGAIHFA